MSTVAELPIQIDQKSVAKFCREHGIRKLSLFGSVVRDDFDPQQSDLDVLVELLPDAHPGFSFFGWGEKLAAQFGRKVDLHTPNSLSKYFRDQVLREAVTIYEQA
jgi:predicted nucleotidyltransferase